MRQAHPFAGEKEQTGQAQLWASVAVLDDIDAPRLRERHAFDAPTRFCFCDGIPYIAQNAGRAEHYVQIIPESVR